MVSSCLGNKPARSAATATQNSTTPNCMPPSTAGNLQKLRPQRHQRLKQHPTQFRKTAASAPKLHAAINLARMRLHHHQHQTECPPAVQQHRHQHLNAQTACRLAPGRQFRKAAPPPAPETACPLVPGRQSRKAAPPPAPEVRTPIAFSYLENKT